MLYSNNKEQWFRDVIMDHYQTPRNKGLIDDTDYKMVHLKNPSCGDDLIMQIKLEDKKIKDIRFEGSGCAICCASASMVSENLKTKSITEAQNIINEFYRMISGEIDFDENLLQEAISLQGVSKLPPRIKCASLSYKAIEQILFGAYEEDEQIEMTESNIK